MRLIDESVGQGAGNRKVHYARGKTLGGSSARNYMVYHRLVSIVQHQAPTRVCRNEELNRQLPDLLKDHYKDGRMMLVIKAIHGTISYLSIKNLATTLLTIQHSTIQLSYLKTQAFSFLRAVLYMSPSAITPMHSGHGRRKALLQSV